MDGAAIVSISRVNLRTCRSHWDRDGFITLVEHRLRDPVTFAAEYDAAIALKIGFRESFGPRMGVGGDATDAKISQVLQSLNQAGGFCMFLQSRVMRDA